MVSFAAVVVVSLVVILDQNEKVSEVVAEGMVSDWERAPMRELPALPVLVER